MKKPQQHKRSWDSEEDDAEWCHREPQALGSAPLRSQDSGSCEILSMPVSTAEPNSKAKRSIVCQPNTNSDQDISALKTYVEERIPPSSYQSKHLLLFCPAMPKKGGWGRDLWLGFLDNLISTPGSNSVSKQQRSCSLEVPEVKARALLLSSRTKPWTPHKAEPQEPAKCLA